MSKIVVIFLLTGAFLSSCGGGTTNSENEGTQENAENADAKPKVITALDLIRFEDKVTHKEGIKIGFGKESDTIVPAKYDKIGVINDGAPIMVGVGTPDGYNLKDGKYGFINFKGEEIVPLQYDKADNFKHGVGTVGMRNEKEFITWGAVNTAGELKLPVEYQDVRVDVYNPIVMLRKDFLWGLMDTTFQTLLEPKYDNMSWFSKEGLCKVTVGNIRNPNAKCGFINLSGEEVIKPIYDDANSFGEGLASVQKKGKWGFINAEGEVVIPFKYEEADEFEEGKCKVKLKGKEIMIDKEGKEVAK